MRIQVNALGLLGLLMVTASVSTADITLNNYFSDSMVLQRDKPVKVWGSADKGADVTVSFSGQTKKTK
ncbi:MAG: sialate O-acetylesterase, partial [Verrucomicrobia bacterium]|nr:sialate O-acetylesterase [Verrucomicrobiota bacterium]